MLGLDIRFVTSLDVGSAEWIYDSLYCARGKAENLIKLHKTQLACASASIGPENPTLMKGRAKPMISTEFCHTSIDPKLVIIVQHLPKKNSPLP